MHIHLMCERVRCSQILSAFSSDGWRREGHMTWPGCHVMKWRQGPPTRRNFTCIVLFVCCVSCYQLHWHCGYCCSTEGKGWVKKWKSGPLQMPTSFQINTKLFFSSESRGVIRRACHMSQPTQLKASGLGSMGEHFFSRLFLHQIGFKLEFSTCTQICISFWFGMKETQTI